MLRTALVIDGNSDSAKAALAGVEQSMARADAQAKQLAAAFSAADVATTRLAQAQTQAKAATDAAKASYAAGEIGLEEYNRQLLETKTAVGLVAAEHAKSLASLKQAQAAYDAAAGGMRRTGEVSGQARMGVQQLGMQLGDMATMFALGARPMQIFASQGGQVLQAVQLMTGGTSKLASFLGGPWGIAIMLGAQILVPLIGNLLDTKDAADLAATGANGLATAQSALGEVFDTVSGKLKTQNELLILNARLTALNLRSEALQKEKSSQDTFKAAGTSHASALEAQTLGITGLPPTVGASNAEVLRNLVASVKAGKNTADFALTQAAKLDFTGVNVSRAEFEQAIIDSATARVNRQAADLIDKSLDSGSLDPSLRKPGQKGRTRRDTGPSAADAARQYQDTLDGLRSRIAAAEQRTATSAEEQAELELRQVENAHRQAARAIANDDNLNAAQKKRLQAAEEEAAQADREAVEFKKQQRLGQEAQQLADHQHQAQAEALQTQLALADTDEERKRLALQIFDAEQAYLRSKLEAVITAHTINGIQDQEAKLAQIDLDALTANAASARQGVARANETEVEKYLRGLHKTSEQLNDDIDHIKIEGLEALTSELKDATKNALGLHGALGDVVGDLIEIGIRREITAPLADLLFPVSHDDGPTDLLSGTPYGGGGGLLGAIGHLFGGHRATGGPIAPGSFYAVNERSTAPGLFFPLAAGVIQPPGNDAGGGGQAGTVTVRLELSDDLDVRIQRVSGPVAVEVVRATAPAIRDAAVAETARLMTRPGV